MTTPDSSSVPAENSVHPVPTYTPRTSAVVGPGDTDPVYLSKAVYGKPQKSLTVHHLQRRLLELGYVEAYADKDGRYGELTRSSVDLFQIAEGLPGGGIMNAETFSAIFEGDENCTVVIDV